MLATNYDVRSPKRIGQSRLLRTYGNDICLLDATYKTTRYALPLFFLAVRTNVDYQVVGSFAVQDESTDTIKEAIGNFEAMESNMETEVFYDGLLSRRD